MKLFKNIITPELSFDRVTKHSNRAALFVNDIPTIEFSFKVCRAIYNMYDTSMATVTHDFIFDVLNEKS